MYYTNIRNSNSNSKILTKIACSSNTKRYIFLFIYTNTVGYTFTKSLVQNNFKKIYTKDLLGHVWNTA